MDCPDACALDVTVDGNDVVAIRGRTDHPDTAGFICTKVARFTRRLDHADRVLTPLRRVGPKGAAAFAPMSWDDAVEEIASRFRDIADLHGAEAILPFSYGGSNGYLTDDLLDRWFFARLGASRLGKTICAVPTTLVAQGMYGRMPGVAFLDFPKAECIVIWGANPKASNIHLVPYLREAKKRGAFIATIDPVRNFSERETDLHLPILPGTDLPIALAMIRCFHAWGALDESFLRKHCVHPEPLLEAAGTWTLERAAAVAEISVGDIETLARVYYEASPAVIRCGWGPERNRNGGQAIAAILSMPALLGKFGVPGGGYAASNRGAVAFDAADVIGTTHWESRRINMTQLGTAMRDVDDPPIRALYVFNANPAATVPNQALVLQQLQREDVFTVVHDQVMTDTAMFADIVLPATTFLEHRDVRAGYGSYVLGRTHPVVEPRGEARSNAWVFHQLARNMAWHDVPHGGDEAALDTAITNALRLNGRTVDPTAFAERNISKIAFDQETPVQFGSVFPRTADERVDLTPDCLGDAPYQFISATGARAFALISPANNKMISSTLGEFNYPTLEVTIHPDDAEAQGVRTGDMVRVFNDLGEVVCQVCVRPTVRPGVLSIPKGAWRKASGNGWTATALCPDHVQVVGDAACFNDARVDLERAG